MESMEQISTGLKGADEVIDTLRPGDNIIWQVDSFEAYSFVVERFVQQAAADHRRLVYIHFGCHAPLIDKEALLEKGADFEMFTLDAGMGFESFTSSVYQIITAEGKNAFYVFDCLSELQEFWCSDLMTGNFFQVTCPYLFERDAVTYFALYRNAHTQDTIARIREVTQLLLNL